MICVSPYKYRAVVISGDKGNNNPEQFRGLMDPHIAVHGSFSVMVNYHAIGAYFTSRGGFALHNPQEEVCYRILLRLLWCGGYTQFILSVAKHVCKRWQSSGKCVLSLGLQCTANACGNAKHISTLNAKRGYDVAPWCQVSLDPRFWRQLFGISLGSGSSNSSSSCSTLKSTGTKSSGRSSSSNSSTSNSGSSTNSNSSSSGSGSGGGCSSSGCSGFSNTNSSSSCISNGVNSCSSGSTSSNDNLSSSNSSCGRNSSGSGISCNCTNGSSITNRRTSSSAKEVIPAQTARAAVVATSVVL